MFVKALNLLVNSSYIAPVKFSNIDIEGPVVIEPNVFSDNRGYFLESYSREQFAKAGLDLDFVQDNQSLSQKGTLRGLHFQAPPYEQGKLVRAISGAVMDVVVDIRKNSPTYGKSYSIELTGENFRMFWVPPGFAHGFITLLDNTIFVINVQVSTIKRLKADCCGMTPTWISTEIFPSLYYRTKTSLIPG